MNNKNGTVEGKDVLKSNDYGMNPATTREEVK